MRLFPLCAVLLASHVLRWVGLSASLSLIGLARSKADLPPRLANIVLAFSLLAPFGAAELARPFPLHQFIIERLSR